MKATSSIPPRSMMDRFLESIQRERPVIVPVELSEDSRPVARKRFIRSMRETRRINYTRDFIF